MLTAFCFRTSEVSCHLTISLAGTVFSRAEVTLVFSCNTHMPGCTGKRWAREPVLIDLNWNERFLQRGSFPQKGASFIWLTFALRWKNAPHENLFVLQKIVHKLSLKKPEKNVTFLFPCQSCGSSCPGRFIQPHLPCGIGQHSVSGSPLGI